MSQVTLPSSWALLLCACAERPRPSIRFLLFVSVWQPEMPPDAGHGKRESAPATIPGCHVFPVLKPSCPAFANRSNGRQDRFQTNAAGGTPVTASHARMTMTVAGLPSRRQERGAFPLSVAPPIRFSVAHCAILYVFSLFLSTSPSVCQCPHAAIPDGISGHFRCWGKGKDGIRNTNFCRQNLHTSQAVVFHRKNLLNLLPNLCMAPVTKTTDARSEDVTREHRTYGEAKRKRTRPAPSEARQVTTT